ncbi:MAG: hypothetical protein IJ246_08155 [Clostridia bacterium]|nr:hypothetical protein [Clostridia bacterium]
MTMRTGEKMQNVRCGIRQVFGYVLSVGSWILMVSAFYPSSEHEAPPFVAGLALVAGGVGLMGILVVYSALGKGWTAVSRCCTLQAGCCAVVLVYDYCIGPGYDRFTWRVIGLLAAYALLACLGWGKRR